MWQLFPSIVLQVYGKKKIDTTQQTNKQTQCAVLCISGNNKFWACFKNHLKLFENWKISNSEWLHSTSNAMTWSRLNHDICIVRTGGALQCQCCYISCRQLLFSLTHCKCFKRIFQSCKPLSATMGGEEQALGIGRKETWNWKVGMLSC